ncbi:MAG: FAD-dependent oxidoreductase [Candidatus Electrothrix sp. LOE2]|nr:FAD-dependent oxidoreductase [Candidatus Electrothrix sp. LOE2]
MIIIGGGLGGLTAGAKLTKDGYKVLLIERNHKPGGCATTFKKINQQIDGNEAQDEHRDIFEELKQDITSEKIHGVADFKKIWDI